MRKPKKPFRPPNTVGARFRPPETVSGHTVSAPVMLAINPPIPDAEDEIDYTPLTIAEQARRGRRW
jgi:hypothetical protein